MNKTIWLALLVSGCAAAPVYQMQLIPFTAKVEAPAHQADAICKSQAQTASANARAYARASPSPTPLPSYDCTTQVQGSSARTNCAPARDPGAALATGLAGIGDAIAADSAGKEAAETAYRGCVAQYGWGITYRCVANCN